MYAEALHDVKGRLQVIVGAAKLLEGSPDKNSRRYAQMIVQSAGEINEIVCRKLEKAGKDLQNDRKLQMKNCDICKILAETVEKYRPAADCAGVAVHLQQPKACVLYSSGEKIKTIAENLLLNAVRFSKKGGMVHVSVEKTAGAVCICVEDGGAGIETVDRRHVFDAGFSKGGSGFGLTLARQAAAEIGGMLTFSSECGRGSRFFLYLPDF